jgi:hypothetical protein
MLQRHNCNLPGLVTQDQLLAQKLVGFEVHHDGFRMTWSSKAANPRRRRELAVFTILSCTVLGEQSMEGMVHVLDTQRSR